MGNSIDSELKTNQRIAIEVFKNNCFIKMASAGAAIIEQRYRSVLSRF